jgi:hypothetical protein
LEYVYGTGDVFNVSGNVVFNIYLFPKRLCLAFLITGRSTRARYLQDVKYTHVVLFRRGSAPDPTASAILQGVDIYMTG